MYNFKLQPHGRSRSGHHVHVLTPKTIAWDMILVLAAVLVLVTMWKAFPSQGAALANFLRNFAKPQPPLEERVPVASPAENNAQPIYSLVGMTYDRSSQKRADAVAALAERGAIETLPRLQELQVVDGNDGVQQAAYRAEDQFRAHVATMLQLPIESIKFIAATEAGNAYAVNDNDLFALRDGEWRFVSYLPDVPNGLAITSDAQVVYLATASTGLWRSLDNGETWKHIQFGLNTPTQLTVTAVTINPENARQVFIALAVQGLEPEQMNALGIFASNDNGESWRFLPDSPISAITTRLVIHEPWTRFMYGVADSTPWRYTLPIEGM